jgi:hypothetical protein
VAATLHIEGAIKDGGCPCRNPLFCVAVSFLFLFTVRKHVMLAWREKKKKT